MVVNQSNHNGKDDDNLPSTQGICSRGGVKKGGQGIPSSSSNIDELIHELEKNAYYVLLKAFTAQSELLTWAKEGLMSNLRKELRITDDQHRQMLEIVGDDQTLARILTWRCTGKDHSMSCPPLPAIFQSRKKQKISHTSPPAPLLKSTLPPYCSVVTSISNRQGLPMPKMYSNKDVADALTFNAIRKGTPRSNVSRRKERIGGGGSRGPKPHNHLIKSESPSIDESLVGQSLWIRWSEDNILYKALIVGYDKEVMLHRIAYDSGTKDETFEWIDLTTMGANDIQWLDNTIDLVSLDGKGHVSLDFPTKHGKGRFKLPMKKSNGRNEGRRPFAKALQAPPNLQSRLCRGEALAEVDNNGTQVKYPEMARFVKEINALEDENDLEKLENGRQITKEYEEMLQKALVMVTSFSIDGESKENDDPSEDGDDSSDNSDSSEDGDSSGNDDSNGLEVNCGSACFTKLDHGEDNGDNDDYIEID